MKTGIGQPIRRKEDARLLVGAGRFSDDVDLPRQARAFVIRSVHAHARIKGIAAERARARKGVLAVLTGADYKADGLKPIPPDASTTMPIEAQRRLPDVVLVNRDGPLTPTPQYPLAVDKVRHVGDPVAVCVALTRIEAEDMAAKREIDFEPLPQGGQSERAHLERATVGWPARSRLCSPYWTRDARLASDRHCDPDRHQHYYCCSRDRADIRHFGEHEKGDDS